VAGCGGVFPEPTFPTPIRACPELSTPEAELWAQERRAFARGCTGATKFGKRWRLLAGSQRRGARRLLSLGAAGSHHLLTLALFARAAELESAAVIIAQPHTQHAMDTLRAALGLGLRVYPAAHSAWLPWVLGRAVRTGDYLIPPGGSNVLGACACADAIDELLQPIADGVLPAPDWIVVPLGSGGNVRGPCRRRDSAWPAVSGARCAGRCRPGSTRGRALSRARSLAQHRPRELASKLGAQLVFDSSQVGAGYGFATAAGARASELARAIGLELDATYTAKAFARVLELLSGHAPFPQAKSERRRRVLVLAHPGGHRSDAVARRCAARGCFAQQRSRICC